VSTPVATCSRNVAMIDSSAGGGYFCAASTENA
jgi:hypothetical protein